MHLRPPNNELHPSHRPRRHINLHTKYRFRLLPRRPRPSTIKRRHLKYQTKYTQHDPKRHPNRYNKQPTNFNRPTTTKGPPLRPRTYPLRSRPLLPTRPTINQQSSNKEAYHRLSNTNNNNTRHNQPKCHNRYHRRPNYRHQKLILRNKLQRPRHDYRPRQPNHKYRPRKCNRTIYLTIRQP